MIDTLLNMITNDRSSGAGAGCKQAPARSLDISQALSSGKIFLHCTFLIISIAVVLSTVMFSKVEVKNTEDLKTVSCGWPMHFLENDLSFRSPPLPWKIDCLDGFPYEARPSFDLVLFAGNVGFFFILIITCFYSVFLLIKKANLFTRLHKI